ncbi:IgGFc-binding protein-like 1, partial [Homarus americanus]
VKYTKHSVMPALHVYAPKVEKNKGWCGLVGTYNGKKDDDFQARDGGLVDVATFAASWNTGVSTTNPKCKDKPDNIKPVCTKTQIKKFKPKCEALLALAKPNCTSPIKPEECVKDMCACVADDEETCFLVIKHTLEQLCGLQECHNEATDLKTRGCYDPQGVYYKEDARFLSECKVNICLQNKFYIFKDAGDQ